MRVYALLLALILIAPACGGSGGADADTSAADVADTSGDVAADVAPSDVTDASPDADTSSDAVADAAPDAAPDTAPDTTVDTADLPDTTPPGCLKATVSPDFSVTYDDSVSIEYSADLVPMVQAKTRWLSFLFERYGDTNYIGTFTLGTDHDANFGNCARCVFVRGDTPDRAWFAASGTLTTALNPFSRKLDLTVTDLRLIEVAVDPLTRESTPIPNGGCIEVTTFSKTGVYPPASWTCPDTAQYDDDTACHCECGTFNPDCSDGPGCLPGDPACEGEVPTGPLPVVGCEPGESCTFDPVDAAMHCTAGCHWADGSACPGGETCVFDFGVGDGDLCLDDPLRIAPDVRVGEACPVNNFQIVCDVVDGFAQGYCDPNNVCRDVCTTNAECTESGHTCRHFLPPDGLGYCGPEPTDG